MMKKFISMQQLAWLACGFLRSPSQPWHTGHRADEDCADGRESGVLPGSQNCDGYFISCWIWNFYSS